MTNLSQSSHITSLSFKIIAVCVLMLTLWSCGSSRKTVPGADTYEPEESAAPQWTDMSVPVTVNITKPQQLKVSGTLTMERGKMIHLSLRFLGMEVGAAYASGDSIYAFSKLQRIYVDESISRALGGYNLSLSDMQDLLIGQSDALSVKLPSGRSVSVSYTPLEGTPLAETVAVNVSGAKNSLAATITYSWDRAKVDTGASRLFSIPAGYRRIAGSSLLKTLSL